MEDGRWPWRLMAWRLTTSFFYKLSISLKLTKANKKCNSCFPENLPLRYSDFRSNRNGYNFAGGKTGFDSQETKLPTYWSTPFSKICLGMKIGHQLRFIVINRHANSLFSLIADGKYRATSLGRNTWKWLIGSRASLQPNCNKEGFNAVGSNPRHSKARIGITANQQNHCGSCDSRIGFGTGGLFDDSNTCGNEATHSPDNGHKHIKALGYILVQWQGTQLTSQILSREAIMKKKM